MNVVEEKQDALGNKYYLAHLDFVLNRSLSPGFWIATATLLLVYSLIAFDVVHRTLSAFLGASLMLAVSYTAGTFYPDFRILTFVGRKPTANPAIVLQQNRTSTDTAAVCLHL